jgi:hypothetical protein
MIPADRGIHLPGETGQAQGDGPPPEREEMERDRGSGLDEEGTVEQTAVQQIQFG